MIGRIYKIVNADESICYVGSTTQSLKVRWSGHKSDFKQWVKGNRNACCMIYHEFKKYGIDKFKMQLIKKIEYNDKCELLKLENHYISTRDCVNKITPYKKKNIYYCLCGSQITNGVRFKERHFQTRTHQEYINSTFSCQCGTVDIIKNKPSHLESKKHQDFLSN
jgi:GIY-YIG catalytic domain